MKNLIFLIFCGLLFADCSQMQKKANASGTPVTAAPRDGVFIHITQAYNDPHRALMPLRMATLMASDKDVIVYADMQAVALMVKNSKDLTHQEFESSKTYLQKLLANKTPVYVCPTCLKIAGFKPEDLMDGIQIAKKEAFFNFTKGRILTFDY